MWLPTSSVAFFTWKRCRSEGSQHGGLEMVGKMLPGWRGYIWVSHQPGNVLYTFPEEFIIRTWTKMASRKKKPSSKPTIQFQLWSVSGRVNIGSLKRGFLDPKPTKPIESGVTNFVRIHPDLLESSVQIHGSERPPWNKQQFDLLDKRWRIVPSKMASDLLFSGDIFAIKCIYSNLPNLSNPWINWKILSKHLQRFDQTILVWNLPKSSVTNPDP